MCYDIKIKGMPKDPAETQYDARFRLLSRRERLQGHAPKPNSKTEKKRNVEKQAYHNTHLLLKNYRNIAWLAECFPDTLAEELELPLGNIDLLIDRVDIELALENVKLENRMIGVRKTRILLDRINEALSVLQRKPENGNRLYELIYLTYVTPEKLSHDQILSKLHISSRSYYRFREQAITILSIRLWAAPKKELDLWIELLATIDSINE